MSNNYRPQGNNNRNRNPGNHTERSHQNRGTGYGRNSASADSHAEQISNMHYYFRNTYYDFMDNLTIRLNNKEPVEKQIKDAITAATGRGGCIIDAKNIAIQNHVYRSDIQPFKVDGEVGLKATVQYPGLLIGIGNTHSLGAAGEIGLGFSFDYVTGLSYFPGSTVKGILKSAFQYDEWITGELQEINKEAAELLADPDLYELFVEDIFENHDIFLDSFVEVTETGNGNARNKPVLNLNHLAPHHTDKELGIMGAVNILTMLRIRPDRKIDFRFILKDSIIKGTDGMEITVTAEQKLILFKDIFETFGAGAKTNVGYGQFSEVVKL